MAAALSLTLIYRPSMGVSFALVKKLAAGVAKSGALPLTVDPASLLAVFAMMLPMALLFSAAMLAIALFSRSSKEAHSYLQPLLIVTIMPAVAALHRGRARTH